MSRIVSFNVPQRDGTKGRAHGRPIKLKIGEREVWFVLQYEDRKPRWLTHFASGYKFGTLDDAETELVCRFSPYHEFTDQELALFLIEKAIAKHGVEAVLQRIDQVPVINRRHKELRHG